MTTETQVPTLTSYSGGTTLEAHTMDDGDVLIVIFHDDRHEADTAILIPPDRWNAWLKAVSETH